MHYAAICKDFHASRPEANLALLRSLPANKRGFILLDLSAHVKEEIMGDLSNEEIVKLVGYLDTDQATDLLQHVTISRRNKIITKMSNHLRSSVESMLSFDPRTAAGNMSLDYIEISNDINAEEVAKMTRKHEKRTGKFPTILVVQDGLLIGELPAHSLAIARKNEKVKKYVKTMPHIQHNKHRDDIMKVFMRHAHNKIVVLDEDESIMGVLYSDDILRLINRQSAKSLNDFAGIHDEEDVLDNALTKVNFRYKWLIVNLATAFLAAAVVGLFENTIAKYVILAAYLPIVAGMGGNAATQTLAVIVRGITLKEIEFGNAKKAILNEVAAGAINGLITGLIALILALATNQTPMFGLIIALAMTFNLIIAGFFGAVTPLIMKKIGKDPATSATIFITTATDVFGFLAFLGLATILL